MKKIPLIGLLLWFFIFAPVNVAKADGIIIPPLPPCNEYDCPPFPRPIAQLEIRYHHVTVLIDNQLARTRVDQVFFNPNDWPVEGTYVFPLPLDAVVSDFTLWIDGKPVSGEILDAQEARQYYEEVVRNLRDPALLEYIERGAVRASVFPIPPQGERRIELEYTQALTAQNGLIRYNYPLNTEKFSLEPLQDVSVRVEILDKKIIRAVYSPSHPIGIDPKSENRVVAGYEEKNIRPDADFTLYYSLGETEAFHLFSYRDPADQDDSDGFFMLLLAPKPESNSEKISKDILLVLDRSGSMDGDKFIQAQSALRYILKKLNPEDRFYLQAFSTGLESYANELRPASEVNEALNWVDRLSAVGSTDINRALLEAASVANSERPTYLIFLTDGLPTEGVVNTSEILNNFSRSAPSNLRVFPFGVGYDVDTVLLDSLSQEHHGLSTYVRPDESLDEILSAFYERISTPVLTDLRLDFGELATYDLFPNPLPDLFAGNQVIVVGRYKDGGQWDVTLAGNVNGRQLEFRYQQQEFTRDSRGINSSIDSLPRLWATRKIGYLLNRIRLDGPNKETIQQIVKLSVRYGIITPYTSYLVTEPMPLGANEQERIVEDQYGQALEAPAESYGKSAVDRADQEGQMQSAEVAPVAPQAVDGEESSEGSNASIRIIGSRTFLLQEGVWTDTAFDPQVMDVQKIVFLSQKYFDILDARPDLAPILALGDRVIFITDSKAYQVITEGEDNGPVEIPQALPTQTEVNETPPPLATKTTKAVQEITQTPIPQQPNRQPQTCLLPLSLIPIAFIISHKKNFGNGLKR